MQAIGKALQGITRRQNAGPGVVKNAEGPRFRTAPQNATKLKQLTQPQQNLANLINLRGVSRRLGIALERNSAWLNTADTVAGLETAWAIQKNAGSGPLAG